jgi:hypothetical protein
MAYSSPSVPYRSVNLFRRRKYDTEEGDHLTSLVFFLSREERRPNPSKCTTNTHTHTVVAMPDII